MTEDEVKAKTIDTLHKHSIDFADRQTKLQKDYELNDRERLLVWAAHYHAFSEGFKEGWFGGYGDAND